MDLPETLHENTLLYEELHQVLLEENRILQTTRKPPGEGFLSRKSALLPRLDGARLALGVGRLTKAGEIPAQAATIGRLQKKMLSLLLLDRENEKLLLKYSAQSEVSRTTPKPCAHLVRRAYSAAAA